MLPELLEQQHGEQVRPGPAARRDVERRRRLADLLAVPARHLLAHVLDHLPLARDHLQRLGDGLAELAQARAAAAVAGGRRRNDDALARQMLGERLAGRALAREGATVVVLAAARSAAISSSVAAALQLFELQLHLIEEARRALRARPVELALELGDLQVLARDHGSLVGVMAWLRQLSFGLGERSAALAASAAFSVIDVVGARANPCGEGITDLARAARRKSSRASYPARSGRNV